MVTDRPDTRPRIRPSATTRRNLSQKGTPVTADSDQNISRLLEEAHTIAVVGLSPKPDRASHRVAAYLQKAGYRIIPVTPKGDSILGERCYPSLEAIPKEIRVDIVDVFRKAEETPPIAAEAVRIGAGALWLQSGITNETSMQTATKGGLLAFQDLCLMVEHRRLGK
ncbi:MAG: CoA-binding protein [Magnetococcales bacterium]|nr:CoA-binding protein [Magnetococcales bacterium]